MQWHSFRSREAVAKCSANNQPGAWSKWCWQRHLLGVSHSNDPGPTPPPSHHEDLWPYSVRLYDRLRSPLAANIFLHAKHFILTGMRFARLIETGAFQGGGEKGAEGRSEKREIRGSFGRESGEGSAAKLRHVFPYGVAQMRRFIIVPHATCVFHFVASAPLRFSQFSREKPATLAKCKINNLINSWPGQDRSTLPSKMILCHRAHPHSHSTHSSYLLQTAAPEVLRIFRSVHRCRLAATPTQLVGNCSWSSAFNGFYSRHDGATR